MSVADGQPLTVRTVLFPDRDAEDALKHELHELHFEGILTDVASQVRDLEAASVRGDVARQAARLLDVDIIDVLITAWTTRGALKSAARSTAAEPSRSESVELANQKITWKWTPSIDLLLNEQVIGTISLELELRLDIALLKADVRGGRLVALRSGTCQLTVCLTVHNCKLPKRTVSLDLRLTVPLGANGIPLVHSKGA